MINGAEPKTLNTSEPSTRIRNNARERASTPNNNHQPLAIPMTTQTDWIDMTKPKQYNILTLPQKLKLIDFLRATTYEDGTSVKQIAEDATKVVGFKVTTFNVRGTAEAAEIELPLARAPKIDPMDSLLTIINSLERRVEALETLLSIPGTVEIIQLKPPVDTCNAASDWPAGSDQAA